MACGANNDLSVHRGAPSVVHNERTNERSAVAEGPVGTRRPPRRLPLFRYDIRCWRDPTGQDAGAADRRLLVIEPKFVSVLKAVSREISTLSPTVRSAWDGRPLAILTRTAPTRAADAHISIIGHITATELQHLGSWGRRRARSISSSRITSTTSG
jgi:hypothetical protein